MAVTNGLLCQSGGCGRENGKPFVTGCRFDNKYFISADPNAIYDKSWFCFCHKDRPKDCDMMERGHRINDPFYQVLKEREARRIKRNNVFKIAG